MAVSFVVNGEQVEVKGADHQLTLLQWLRASGRTGSKEGCAEGECGACAVALLGEDGDGRACFHSVNSCLVPLAAVSGRAMVTVEGVAGSDGALHPVQQALIETGGSQCGYCTPGFVVSLFCEYYRPGREGYDPEAISGNLCRCTGYRPIVDAARALPPARPDDPRAPAALRQVISPAPAPPEWESGPGPGSAADWGLTPSFARPADLTSLWRVVTDRPDAVLIAGGTDLMAYSNQRHERFPALISLERLSELRRFEVGPTEIVLGAGLCLAEIEERLRSEVPMLAQLWPLFSSRLIRNRATLGGNLATASPIGDSAPALLALDAQVTLSGRDGQRQIPLSGLFVGYRKTALGDGEIILDVRIPRAQPAWQRFYKVSKRVLDDISTIAAAFALDLSTDGRRIERLRMAYGGVAATPLRAHAAEALAVGRPWTAETVALLVDELGRFASPLTDHRGSAAYRRAMIGRLLEKLFAEIVP